MSEFQRMSDVLSATGLYDISQNSLVYAELQAYAEGLDMAFDELDEMLKECFAETAESYGLTMRESWLKRYNPDRTLESRRNAIIKALSVCQTDYTFEGMRKIRDSFNLHGNFYSYTSPLKVTFECTDTLTNSQKTILSNQMKRFMPCWLNFELISVCFFLHKRVKSLINSRV